MIILACDSKVRHDINNAHKVCCSNDPQLAEYYVEHAISYLQLQ